MGVKLFWPNGRQFAQRGPREEASAYGPTDEMGKLKRRNKGTSGDPDDLYCRRTSSSETPETVTNLLELEWADAPDGDPVRSEAVKQKPVSRQSSMGMGARQWQSPLGRPISQPVGRHVPAPVARDVEPAKQPGAQSKSMLALLSATFPDVPSDDLTQSAIEVRSSSWNGSLSVCFSSYSPLSPWALCLFSQRSGKCARHTSLLT